MQVGDLVRLKSLPHLYGIVLEVRENVWVGNQVTVNWLESPFKDSRKFYAQSELEVINEEQV